MLKLRVQIILCGVMLSARLQGASPYNIRDLGLVGRTTIEVSLNDLGQVVMSVAPEEPHGSPSQPGEVILIEENIRTNVGSFGGPHIVASAINNKTQIVGQADLTNGSSAAFRYNSGQLENLELQRFGATGSIATSINDRGDIVGQAHYGTVSRAFRLGYDGVYKPLKTLGGNHAFALDVNENGTVVGASRTDSDDVFVAFMSHENQVLNLGTLGGLSSSANAINDHSMIIGSASTANNIQHAALFVRGSMPIDLAPQWAQSGAAGINSFGQIVGFVTNTPDQDLKAALFSQTNPPVLLQDLIPPDSGWTSLYAAGGINDRGQIVGSGIFNNQPGIRAFLMTPIPESAALSLAFVGAAIFLVTLRAHRH